MPYMTKKLAAAPLSSWDAFPEPPPEAKDWVPDPDSIARPRTLKDARFNKDPYSEQKAALKREARMRGLNGYGSGSGSGSVTSSVDDAAATRVAAAVGGEPPTSANVPLHKSTSGGYQPGSVLDRKTETPVVTKTSVPKPNGAHFLARHDTPIPAWAGPLEKLLAEAPSVGPALSLPPHLRKPISAKSNSMLDLDQNYKAASEASRRVSGKSNVEVSSDNEAIDDNALAWKMATTDMGIEDPGEGLRLQQMMLPQQKKATSTMDNLSYAYEREISIKTIRFMEDELDINNRLTRAELVMMDDAAFAACFVKVKSAHKIWWIAEKR